MALKCALLVIKTYRIFRFSTLFKQEHLLYNSIVTHVSQTTYYTERGDSSVADILLANMERINVIAELLYEDLRGNPRAQVLVEIILEASQVQIQNKQQQQQ